MISITAILGSALAREVHQRDVDAFFIDLACVRTHAAAADVDHVAVDASRPIALPWRNAGGDEGEIVQWRCPSTGRW